MACSRWEKVLKRLMLLNKNYPLKGKDCDLIEVQHKVESNRVKEDQDKYTKQYEFLTRGLVLSNSLYLNCL